MEGGMKNRRFFDQYLALFRKLYEIQVIQP